MLVSSYFLIGRRFCRRCFVLSGLFGFAVSVYLVIALVRIYLPSSAHLAAPRQPACLRPQLDHDLPVLPEETPPPLRCHEDEPDWIDASNGTFQVRYVFTTLTLTVITLLSLYSTIPNPHATTIGLQTLQRK